MHKKYDVLCMGLITSDILIRPVNKDIFDVDTTRVDSIDIMPGGDAMNEAIIFSKLGIKVGLAGKVGGDSSGQIVIEEAEKSGVDISNVKIDTSINTATSIVLINQKGDRNFICCKGNNDKFSLDDIDLNLIKQAKIISMASIFELPMLEECGIEIIFKEARANEVITVADITHDVSGIGLTGIRNILSYTDIFMPSYVEAVYLTGEEEPHRAAEILLNCGVKMVVIKLGAKGCYIRTREEEHYICTYDAPVIDTTGAGDNFVAGFLTGILQGWDIKKCGMFANAVGSVCVGEVGATKAVKSMDQILKFIETGKLINYDKC